MMASADGSILDLALSRVATINLARFPAHVVVLLGIFVVFWLPV
jgi:hypothetical protein